MKKLTFIVAMLVLGTGATFAQTPQKDQGRGKHPSAQQHKGHKKSSATPQERVERMTARMTEKYSLTPDQSVKVQEIGLNYYAQMQAMRQSKADAGAKKAGQEQKQALKQQYTTQLKAVLSAEQYAQFEADMAQRAEQYGQRKGQYHKQKRS